MFTLTSRTSFLKKSILENFVQCSLIIFSSPTPPFLPTQFCVLYYFSFQPIKSGLCRPHIFGCLVFHWSVTYFQGATLLKKTASPSPVRTKNSFTRGETSCFPPLTRLGFSLAWAFVSLAYVITVTVSSYVKLPCCIYPLALAHTLFPCYLLYSDPWAWWGRGCDRDVSSKAQHSVISCFLHHGHLWVSVLATTYCKQKLLRRDMRDWYNNTPWGVIFILCPHTRTIVADFSLRA